MNENTQTVSGERADILSALAERRHFLRHTAENLTDEQANTRSTVSELTVGGLIKHVTEVEKSWADFTLGKQEDKYGETDWENPDSEMMAEWANAFRLVEGETLAGALAEYEKVAEATDELIRTLDLDMSYPLPEAPWNPPGASWSVRRVFLHLIGETAQHAGHADIIRETIDGQKSMG